MSLSEIPAIRSRRRRAASPARSIGWVVVVLFTGAILVPIAAIVLLAFRPASGPLSFYLGNLQEVLGDPTIWRLLVNTLFISLTTAAASVIVGAAGGYVLSRARNRLIGAWSLILFAVQSLPLIIFVVPLFVMFSRLGLTDNVAGVSIIYVATNLAVGCWMMSAYIDSIPITLEEAAWIDGCSVFGGFLRIIVRNSLPGVLSTAIFCFLVAWNDYLIAVIFLRSDAQFTLALGMLQYFQQQQTEWGPVMAIALVMMLPPLLIFATLGRFFSLGGVAGSLAGR